MYEWWFGNFNSTQLAILAFTAVMAGINKTGMPGIGIIMVPLLALSFPARVSTGLLLPLLALSDLFAVAYYRKQAQWFHVCRLLPWSLTGIVTGSIIMRYIVDDRMLKPLIGVIVLSMLGISWYRKWRQAQNSTAEPPTHGRGFAILMGFAAGLTTQMANAAGPIMIIYLLAMGLDKQEFIGTTAWYFLITNWLKLPLFVWDGRIDWSTIRADVAMLPFIALGAWAGIFILKKMPQKLFNWIMQFMALAAALNLCWSAKALF